MKSSVNAAIVLGKGKADRDAHFAQRRGLSPTGKATATEIKKAVDKKVIV
jgi:hypothetical protein